MKLPSHPDVLAGSLVIFGITGDLAHKKLLPALYRLVADDLLPADFTIFGISRREGTPRAVLAPLRASGLDAKVLDRLEAMLHMVKMDLDQVADYHRLKTILDEQEMVSGVCSNRLYYLSMPPAVFGPVVDLLGESGLNRFCQHGSGESRLLVEKPFGYDLASAQALIERVSAVFSETQIFRIDHYLAKETAQNILTFRFANPLFEAVWCRDSVSQIIITASETIGIEGRVAFYEQTGALRDLIQSHLLQLMALVMMEDPATMTAEAIHTEKLKLLQAVCPIEPGNVDAQAVRRQYEAYRSETGMPDSVTETFAAIKLQIDTPRWKGVPVQLVTGKLLARKETHITLVFMDEHTHEAVDNQLTIHIQPDEGISMGILVKRPGFEAATELVEMDFRYARSFEYARHPDAYERVLVDAIKGDRTLFATSEEVLASWRIIEAVVQAWQQNPQVDFYTAGAEPEQLAWPTHK